MSEHSEILTNPCTTKQNHVSTEHNTLRVLVQNVQGLSAVKKNLILSQMDDLGLDAAFLIETWKHLPEGKENKELLFESNSRYSSISLANKNAGRGITALMQTYLEPLVTPKLQHHTEALEVLTITLRQIIIMCTQFLKKRAFT
jgi:hypothetical protein